MEAKIAHIIRGKDRGGISSIIFPLIKGLQSRGFKVFLIIIGRGPVVQEAFKREIPVTIFNRKIRGFDPFMVARMIGFIREEKIDLIHTHSIGSNFHGRLAKIFLGVPLVTTVHADTSSTLKGVFKRDVMGSILYHLDTSMASYSDKFITVSNALHDKLIERGIKREKIAVIPNGIEGDNMRGKDFDIISVKKKLMISNEKVVGTVGRLTPVKNHALFLKSAKAVLDKGVKAKFLVVGDGPLKADMEILAQDLGIKGDVIFTGWHNGVHELYKIMDVFVLSSHMEGMPVTLLEAMAHGLPVVSTKVGGIPEVVEDMKTGYLIPPDDSIFLANAIHAILTNPWNGKQMGLLGAKVVREKFTLDAMVEGVAGVYRELLNSEKNLQRIP